MNIKSLLLATAVFFIVLVYPAELISQTTSSVQNLIDKGYIKLDKKTDTISGVIYEDVAAVIKTETAPLVTHLENLDDVQLTNMTANQLLRFSNGYWKNWTPTYISLTNLYGSGPITYNSATGTYSLSYNSSNLKVNSSNQLDLVTSSSDSNFSSLTVSGAISAATINNTINDLVISDGALSGITGYSQSSGNFAISGSGTFTTGSGLTTIGGDLYFSSTDPSITAPSGSSFNFSNRMVFGTSGDSGSLSSSGGVIHLNMTNDIGAGIAMYSNAGTDAEGNMINIKVDNSNFAQAAFYMNYDGSSNAVEIVSNSTDSSSNALSVTGNNPNDSTVGVIGYETGRGTVKISHHGTGTDANASGLSVDLQGTGTKAQGVYVDSTASGGTTGNLLRLRNQSIDKFVVNYQGNLSMAGNMSIGATGTNTTFTKTGNTNGDEFFVGTNGAFRVQRSASNSEAFRVQINGDSQGRWLGTSDGRLKWGDGSTTQDVVLRRGAAGLLWLEGAMAVNINNGDYDTAIRGTTDNGLFFADASANSVGIGTTAPAYKFQVRIDGSNEGHVTSTGAWANTSDARMKKNVLDLSGGLDKILGLRPVSYDPITAATESISGLNIGFLAQEVEQIIPQIVDTDSRGLKSIAYGQLTPLLVAAVKEQQQLVHSQENRIKTLEGLINEGIAEPNKGIFESVVSFLADVTFKGKTSFENEVHLNGKTYLNEPILNSNSAGFAKIKKGSTQVNITFDKTYSETPIIVATPNDSFTNFTIKDRSPEKFTIVTDQALSEDVTFSWTATAVHSPKTYESDSSPEMKTPSLIPTISVTETPQLSITPTPSL